MKELCLDLASFKIEKGPFSLDALLMTIFHPNESVAT